VIVFEFVIYRNVLPMLFELGLHGGQVIMLWCCDAYAMHYLLLFMSYCFVILMFNLISYEIVCHMLLEVIHVKYLCFSISTEAKLIN
jgi:hypothetical protein